MAKTAIHEQSQALSVYFQDMLAEPEKKQPTAETITQQDTVETESNSPTETMAEVEHQSTAPLTAAELTQNFLFCQIGGMSLAIAVSSLNNIVHWPQQGLNQLPDMATWQLGLLQERGKQCEVLDIRPLLEAPETDSDTQPDYILLVDQGRHGIACNAIEQIGTVQPDTINWRQDRDQRPWLLGVINDSMHNIVDLPALLAAMEQGEMA